MKSSLRRFAEEILRSVDILENDCLSRGVDIPDIDDPSAINPNSDNDFERSSKEVADAVSSIVTSATLLVQCVRSPSQSVRIAASSHITSASLRCVTELNIVDLIRIGGSKGTHVEELAGKCAIEPGQLSQVLRLLSAQGIFKEVAPDKFTNNRLSTVLDKGLSSNDLDAVDRISPSHDQLYKNPQSSPCALFCHAMDECAKATSYLFEAISDRLRSPGGPTAVSRGFNTSKSFWEILELEENRLRRFGLAMEGVAKAEPQAAILQGFDWESVANGGHVVDVGGGVGTVSMRLASAYPDMNIVVQDREQVVKEGLKRWATVNPTAIERGKVKLEAHNFFEAQPIKNPDVFFVKSIVHDWPDDAALTILRHLREAAGPETRLFSMDKLLPYTCETTATTMELVKKHEGSITFAGPAGGEVKSGMGNLIPYLMSVMMIGLLNGQERTLQHTVDLYRKAGWEIYKVYQTESQGLFSSQMQSRPIAIP